MERVDGNPPGGGKCRRKQRRRKAQPVVFDIAVRAVAASVSRSTPGERLRSMECYSHLYIEGTLPKPVIRDVRTVILSVFEDGPADRGPGSAIGFGAESWSIVARLPRTQFADLLAIALAGELHHVSIAFDAVKRGKGDVISVSYRTKQIPFYAEDDEVPP